MTTVRRHTSTEQDVRTDPDIDRRWAGSYRFAHLADKTLRRGVHDTALNTVWDAVGPEVCALLLERGIDWSPINRPVRFFTRGKPGNLGPVDRCAAQLDHP